MKNKYRYMYLEQKEGRQPSQTLTFAFFSVAGKADVEDCEIDGYVVSSESCAFQAIGAKYYREVLPGQTAVDFQNLFLFLPTYEWLNSALHGFLQGSTKFPVHAKQSVFIWCVTDITNLRN